jgi:hypothetical protein
MRWVSQPAMRCALAHLQPCLVPALRAHRFTEHFAAALLPARKSLAPERPSGATPGNTSSLPSSHIPRGPRLAADCCGPGAMNHQLVRWQRGCTRPAGPAAGARRTVAPRCQVRRLPVRSAPSSNSRPELLRRPRAPTPPPPQAAQPQEQLQYTVSEARSAAELRAAAYLRAYSFYSYPADRNAYVARVGRLCSASGSISLMFGAASQALSTPTIHSLLRRLLAPHLHRAPRPRRTTGA